MGADRTGLTHRRLRVPLNLLRWPVADRTLAVMALDQITKALVAEFLDQAQMASGGEATDFERFVAHVVIAPQIDAALDYGAVLTGSGGDTGLDAIGIIVNGQLATDPDDIDVLADGGATLDVNYIFVQTETATSFSTSKVGQIEYGVKDFFASEPTLARNEAVTEAADVSAQILKHARLFRNGNPSCTIYYATAGRWMGDQNLRARIGSARSEIDDLNLFSKVTFVPLDAREIQRRYQTLNAGVEREFIFQNRIPFPDIDGVSESHLGYISATDLVAILEGDDGALLSTIFYDNVRDFQGESNSVNHEIAKTLDSERRSRFPLMNNGVTVIARSVRQTGTRFTIQGFQVVNGCQTSNVLWANRERLDPSVLVPLRLISTEDEDVIVDIIRATNRQTEVKEEQFFATSDYLKQLESYFESTTIERRLYLERRLKQHAGSSVERTRIIPFNSLVRSFASLALNEPHRATRNYKQVLERIPVDILNPDHRPAAYLASASSLYRLEFLFRNNVLDRRFSAAKYHLLLASRLIIRGGNVPPLNGRESERWAESLLDTYWDPTKSEKVFKQAASDIDLLAGGDLSRDQIRTLPFTEKVLAHYRTA